MGETGVPTKTCCCFLSALLSLRPENNYCNKVQATDAAMRINGHLDRERPDQILCGRHDHV
jgi:hypothetical protein